MNFKKIKFIIALVLLALALGYVSYQYYLLDIKADEANEEYILTYENYERTIESLNNEIKNLNTDRNLLAETLKYEQNRNDEFRDKIIEIQGTLGDLERLSETDPELLKKYSKVFFLSEHYTPSDLRDIPPEYLYVKDEPEEIHTEVFPHLEDMILNAEIDDVFLYIVSGYRSFGTQTDLKHGYVVTYGTGTANQFSAEQGYSEHQLGTAVDFTTEELKGGLDGLENTTAYQWLLDNAHEYGFVLSYPEGNSYYQFEPWHWRFVGVDLASDLYNQERNFYDLSQREIDSYLLNIFD
ncbi:MAG: M15 family metallopeptidase [Candidatus Paceibacterota bacterium]